VYISPLWVTSAACLRLTATCHKERKEKLKEEEEEEKEEEEEEKI